MRRLAPPVALALCWLVPLAALGEKGSLALLNVGPGGWEIAEEALAAVDPLLGGWSRQPGISSLLAGRPSPGSLPVGDTGRDLVRFVENIRASRAPAETDMVGLCRLLGVDYLVLLQVRTKAVSARLYSLHRRAFSPHGFEGRREDLSRLRTYVVDQAGGKAVEKKSWTSRWWIWAIAGGLAALTLGLALASYEDDGSGDLKIRVGR